MWSEVFFDHPTLNARQARWLEFLCELDFEIKHIKGKENKVADALSRKVQEMHLASLSIFQSYLSAGRCRKHIWHLLTYFPIRFEAVDC